MQYNTYSQLTEFKLINDANEFKNYEFSFVEIDSQFLSTWLRTRALQKKYKMMTMDIWSFFKGL